MLIAVGVLVGLLLVVVAGAGLLARAASGTSTLSLAESAVVAEGELLRIDPGAEFEETVVVRRVMPDRTLSRVVLIRPYRPWHRFRWTRRWL